MAKEKKNAKKTKQEAKDVDIRPLLAKAEAQGFVTLDDLMEQFPQAEEDLNGLEDLFIKLGEAGVQVLYGDETEEPQAQEEQKQKKAKPTPQANLSEIASDDTISLYLKEMARVPLLTAEEEVSLARTYEEGRMAQEEMDASTSLSLDDMDHLDIIIERGEGARAHLIKANTRLVVSIAKRYLGQGVPFLDLIQEGKWHALQIGRAHV